MAVITERLTFSTAGRGQAIDITSDLHQALAGTGLLNGVLTAFVPGATGALTTVEYEPGMVRDLEELWERLAPAAAAYHHNRAQGDDNGHSHVRASLLGPSLSVPFCDGELTLGTWQQVVLINFDTRPRERQLVLQFMGEA